MTEPAFATPAPVTPPQFPLIASQVPAMFANHLMVGTDGNTVTVTFSQAVPIAPPGPSGEMQKFQNVPAIALPVAKVVFVPQMVPQIIETLQALLRQLDEQKSHSQ